GNSLKSDVLPVLAVGGQAVHIPYHTTWELEKVSEQEREEHHYLQLKNLAELTQFLLPLSK
ncbi:MAG: HAD family hydrolase, partial [Bacteroidota bacterium]